jgi:hypothetical protein
MSEIVYDLETGEPMAVQPGPTPEEIDQFEICPTPPALAIEICKRVALAHGDLDKKMHYPRILEPSAGDGAFVSACRAVWPTSQVVAVEPRAECRDTLLAAGACHVNTYALEAWLELGVGAETVRDADLVIGNPPFTKAEAHIRLLLGLMKPGAILAFLLRTGFYESLKRLDFWRTFPEQSFSPIVPRPGFKLNGKGKKGTDSQSYGLFVWRAGATNLGGDTPLVSHRLPHIVWKTTDDEDRKQRKPRGKKKEPKVEAVVPASDDIPTLE